MSRFKKVVKKKELESALAKHPLRELESQVKEDYIKGLVFIATEDENFDEDEKAYISSLMKNIGVDEAKLSEFETFASSCEEDELLSFMDRLKDFDEDIKINFMIEVVVITFKDGEFDEAEQGMFDDYLEMLEITEQKDDIMYLATALINKDIDLALSFYTAKKEMFEKYDYMFDMVDIDIEKELKELYTWEWVEWRMEYGKIENDNLVASKPVNVRQASVFLNSLLISNTMKQVNDSSLFELIIPKEEKTEENTQPTNIGLIGMGMMSMFSGDDGDDITIFKDYETDTNLNFEDGFFIYQDVDADVIGLNENGINTFVSWINLYKNEKVNYLDITCTSYDYVRIEESTKNFLTSNLERFYANANDKTYNRGWKYFDETKRGGDYATYSKLDGLNYTFRVMKVEGE